ncbi:unnamed protein product [Lymnaea stagnalis]|uniref:Uncharacterized protein n=1 Tax=Lymnaea stagnalis TaxID=6523 RepID=A0AAV2I2E2_LYMST
MFGEFFLNEIEGPDNTCTRNFNDDRCVSSVGQYYGPIILAAFVLVVNLLIFSLIVAKFNSNITYMEEKSVEIWRHQMFKLTMEYHRIIFLQPPLLLLCVVFGVFRYREENRKREESQVAYLQKFEQDVVLYLKQQIDDGRFFKRLREYKRVGKIDFNVTLSNFQSASEEFYTSVAKEMSQMENLKLSQKEAKEDLLKINIKIEKLQEFIKDVPSKLDTLLTPSKKDISKESLSKDDVQAMLQQSEIATAEKVSGVMSRFSETLEKIADTTKKILNKERKFNEAQ